MHLIEHGVFIKLVEQHTGLLFNAERLIDISTEHVQVGLV